MYNKDLNIYERHVILIVKKLYPRVYYILCIINGMYTVINEISSKK